MSDPARRATWVTLGSRSAKKASPSARWDWGWTTTKAACRYRRSDGNHYFVKNAAELAKVFNHEFGDVTAVVAQEVCVQVKCAEGVRPIRVLGRDAEIVGQDVIVQVNQIYSAQEKSVLLEVEV